MLCGPFVWGFWWVFPLIALVMCLGCLIMALRFARSGRRFGCMGSHCGMADDNAESPR